MCRHPYRFGLLPALLIATSGLSSAAYRGYVELPWTPTTCLQGTHFLTDPCAGNTELILDDQYGGFNLAPYVCTYVDVNGPDVGVECLVIEPASVAPARPTCAIMDSSLLISGAPSPVPYWNRAPCARSYDLIRGVLPGMSSDGSQINLGPVTCLANDVPQSNYPLVTGPADAASPPLGTAFFYLVRAAGLPDGDTTYGHSSHGLEEVPLSGDCAP